MKDEAGTARCKQRPYVVSHVNVPDPKPVRRTADLRRHRVSFPCARYFITVCADRPENRLVSPNISSSIASVLDRAEADGDWEIMARTIMPDHIHLLVTLGDRLEVHRVVAKLKSLTATTFRGERASWQENFHEHRLRPDEVPGPYARYIFLNPYRAGLIGRSTEWPLWRRSAKHDFDFMHMLEDGKYPPPEWLTCNLDALNVSAANIGRD